jgi:hypothetical protein
MGTSFGYGKKGNDGKTSSFVTDFNKKYDALVSISITVTPPSGFHNVLLFKNKKDVGHLSTTTSTKTLITDTITSYLHTLWGQEGFEPVIRSVSTNERVIVVLFKFDKKYIKIIRKFMKSLVKIYESKLFIKEIDFKSNYSYVMTNHKL